MTDYNEQEQWERLKLWLRENGLWIVTGVAIGVLGLVGWNWWGDRQVRIAEEAGTRFTQMVDAFARNDRTRGFSLIDEIGRDYGATPYADLARLTGARVHVEANELDKAAASLTTVMNGAKDEELRLVARLRLARVQAAQGKPDDALATLNGAQAGEFAARFDEARGDILFAKGDAAGALKAYQSAHIAGKDGAIDRELLDLKIRDLGGVPQAPSDAAAAPNG
jgi:predicted negative regulator of RcsB-dependent stress response